MNIIAIIPARSGSKAIKDKNIRNFCGHPMIAWTIAAAKLSKNINRIIVTTDSEEYADISKYYGAEVPFLRPKEISKDNSKDIEFVEHLLNWLKNNENIVPDYLVHLRPTSPLRNPNIIDKAIDSILADKNATSLLSAHVMGYPAQKYLKIEESGYFNGITGKIFIAYPRQELIKSYQGNAYVDILVPSKIQNADLYGDKMLPFITDENPDIDNINDLINTNNIELVKKYSSEILEYLNDFKPYFGSHKEYLGIPKNIKCLICDFDGVFTNNKVITDQYGNESVVCDRSDGYAINILKSKNIKCIVISQEQNEVVKARCKKLNIECFTGINKKIDILKEFLDKNNYSKDEVVYIGNDINDLECIQYLPFSAAPIDAYDIVKNEVSVILNRKGGEGAIREFVDKYIL